MYYYPTVYACIASGATFYGAATRWTLEECAEYAVPLAGVTHFLVDPAFVPHAVAAVEACYGGDLSRIFVFSGPGAPATYTDPGNELTSWSSLLGHGKADWQRITDLKMAQDTIAMRLSTGGTSGAPKMAQLSHYAAIAHIYQWTHSWKTHAFEVRALHYLGLNGISGHAFISTAMKLGFPVYLLRYSIPDIQNACEAIKPSLMMVDPFTMLQLVKMLPEGSTALQSLRDIRLPAMDFPANARKIVQSVLHPDCLMSRPYGLTEMGSVSAMLYNQREHHDPSGVGFTFPGIQVKLVDDCGSEVTEYDSPAEILVKTPAMFTDYYNNPTGTAGAFRDGWFVTGDIGYISSKTQQWYLIGRKKYVFKVSGKYVAPEEIESLLVSHKDITDAAIAPFQVEGHKDPVIKAFVILKSQGALAETDILSFVEPRLTPEKMITGGVYFVDSIPRNGTRKIIRWKLFDMIQKDTETPGTMPNGSASGVQPSKQENGESVAKSKPNGTNGPMNGHKEVNPDTGSPSKKPFGSLYAFPGCPRLTALLAVAAKNKLDIEIIETRPANSLAQPPDGVPPEYFELHPLGKVPTFKGADGFVITECIAIVLYCKSAISLVTSKPWTLANKQPVTTLDSETTLLGSGPQEYASVVQWLSFANTELMPALGSWLRPLLGADPYDPALAAAAKENTLTVTDTLGKRLADRDWLVGKERGQLTVADVFVASMLARGLQFVLDEEWRRAHTVIMEWFVRVRELEWVKKAIKVEMCKETITPQAQRVHPGHNNGNVVAHKDERFELMGKSTSGPA